MALQEIKKDAQGIPTGLYGLIAGGTLWADAPVGVINAFGGAEAPTGWLLCQGQAISRTDYADLFDVIGTAFGAGDGSTTFNLPDMTGKTAMGVETGHALGASEDGALPNIKGGITGGALCSQAGVSGAFNTSGVTDKYYNQTGTFQRYSFTFNANRSNSIYTDGQTKVDPANVRVNYIIKAVQIALPADLQAAIEDMNLITYGG